MARSILAWGCFLAVGALALNWVEYQFLARTHPMGVAVGLLAAAFMGFGIFIGARLFGSRSPVARGERNLMALQALGISDRELEVLELLAAGRSNKEIANRLGVSPNTVKTHVARLYSKLEVSRRTEAVLRARELGVLV